MAADVLLSLVTDITVRELKSRIYQKIHILMQGISENYKMDLPGNDIKMHEAEVGICF